MTTTSVVVKMPGMLMAGEDDASSPHGTFDVILSTPDTDRDGEQLHTAEWATPLPGRITFDVDHGMSVEKTIGSGVPFLNADGNLQVRGTYASTPLAQTTRTLVGEGHIFATSVTFLRHESEDANGATVTRRELLNGAFVSIPANPAAIVLASKDATVKATKSDRLQQIHDLSVDNGATCKHAAHTSVSGKGNNAAPGPAAAPAPAATRAHVDALLALARATVDAC